MKKIYSILLSSLISISAFAYSGSSSSASATSYSGKHGPISFLENKGQITDQFHNPRTDIQFSIKAAPGLNIFIGNGAIHYQFSKAEQNPDQVGAKDFALPFTNRYNSQQITSLSFGEPARMAFQPGGGRGEASTFTMYRMDVELIGANKNAQVIAEEKQNYYENYFTSSTCNKGGITAYTYNKITYKNIYPHIDWVLFIKDGSLKHEFVVNEGGKASDIQLKYGGATDLKINLDGSLVALTPQGSIVEQAPLSYQSNARLVQSDFKISQNIVSYEMGNYSGQVIIDPTLVWSTYFGGDHNETGWHVVNDTSGVYLLGYTNSFSNIATAGAYEVTDLDTGLNNFNIFLTKFSTAGTVLWSTYYGGIGSEYVGSLVLSASGNIYISGGTNSVSAIATPGAYQEILGGSSGDGFIAKFSPLGSLIWGTYYGGPNPEQIIDITVDPWENLYITGYTNSVSGIATPGAHQTANLGSPDAFLAKFNSDGVIQWGTYFGSSPQVVGFGVATDSMGGVYLGGYTKSSYGGIATPGAYQTIPGDGYGTGSSYEGDAFLAKFDTGGVIQWSTYFGGTGYDRILDVATDRLGNVIIGGVTESVSGIASPGAYQTTMGDCCDGDGFLAKFNTTGSLLWGTYYGGPVQDFITALVVDDSGNVFVTGTTSSPSGIATSDAFQPVYGGGVYIDSTGNFPGDAFLAKFNGSGSLLWGSYFGAVNNEFGQGVTIDHFGNMYICGTTLSDSGISTSGAYQPDFGGGINLGIGRRPSDAFLAKISYCIQPTLGMVTGPSSVCVGTNINLTDTSVGGLWAASNGAASVSGGIVTGIVGGVDTITYSVTNTCGNSTDSVRVIQVLPLPVAGSISIADTLCMDSSLVLTATVPAGLWSTTDPSIATITAGIVTGLMVGIDTIKYVVSNSCGSDTTSKVIYVKNCSTGINDITSSGQDILLYPNPANNDITITAPIYVKEVSICNLLGQSVFTGNYYDKKVVIDMSHIPSGIYLVKVNDSKVFKVVKE